MASDEMRVEVQGEMLTLFLRRHGVAQPMTIEEARQLSSDLSAALIEVGRVIGKRKQAEAEAARLTAQSTERWGLWSGGRDERGELVHMGVSWPNNIVDTLPLAEARRQRDEHNAALPRDEEVREK